jgi:hypothetical protein
MEFVDFMKCEAMGCPQEKKVSKYFTETMWVLCEDCAAALAPKYMADHNVQNAGIPLLETQVIEDAILPAVNKLESLQEGYEQLGQAAKKGK